MALFSRKSSRTPDASRHQAAPTVNRPAPSADHPWNEQRVREIGEQYLAQAKKNRLGMLTKQFWSDKLMDWTMKDHDFKVQLFRFVDTFPVLRTPDAVHEHLVDYLTQPGVSMPPGLGMGLRAGGVAKSTMTKTISGQIEGMGRKFIAGTDAESAHGNLEKLWKHGMAFSVDLLGEACVSDAEADMYQGKYLDLIENLPKRVADWKPNERLEKDHLGDVPRVNISVKITSLSARATPMAPESSVKDLMSRLVPILEKARDNNVLINFDMEQFAYKDLTLLLFEKCCEAVDFPAGIAMQAYLRSGDDDARRIADWSRRTGRQVTVRLVKGAYWDYETIHAEEMGWPCPVWGAKSETDACFERMSEIFLESTPREPGEGGVKLALGSHNVRSIAAAFDGMQRRNLPKEAIELQMLHGMADQLKGEAVDLGYRIREYVPVGEMIPGMAYLVRRLLENTSNESWLRAGFLEDADTDRLLASPHPLPANNGLVKGDLLANAPERHQLSPAVEGVGDGRPFMSEPWRDFSRKDQREAFAKAIEGASVPEVKNDGTEQDIDSAIATAHEYFPTWRDMDPIKRSNIFVKAAEIMRSRRDELTGVVIKENGKGWVDADGDVCEAIDFIEYYARHAAKLFQRERMGKFIGELDEQWYQPRGVAGVISPWNFPLAICTGMTSAALVTGNTVVLKPAEQTPGIAKLMVDIFHEAGVPKEALHMVAGPGETCGARLVRDTRVSLLAFTGSKAVGLDIIQAAGRTPDEQPFVKKVVCEMGGKNAVIVDTSADLDEAVLGVRASAFNFQGQKCSACSRVIVVDDGGGVYEEFVERLVESTRSLVIGDPINPSTDVGPVIDEEAAEKIRHYIARGKEQATCALELHVPDGLELEIGKPFVGPVIFTDVEEDHDIAREEIFGPVLSILRAKDYDDALRIANSSPYKLTGGVFSRKPAHLEKAKREFRVGNLYLNRGITGAMVARQPFGGFGMSGVGSKAGGKDYLLQFVEPRASCENTMRRGFAPEL